MDSTVKLAVISLLTGICTSAIGGFANIRVAHINNAGKTGEPTQPASKRSNSVFWFVGVAVIVGGVAFGVAFLVNRLFLTSSPSAEAAHTSVASNEETFSLSSDPKQWYISTWDASWNKISSDDIEVLPPTKTDVGVGFNLRLNDGQKTNYVFGYKQRFRADVITALVYIPKSVGIDKIAVTIQVVDNDGNWIVADESTFSQEDWDSWKELVLDLRGEKARDGSYANAQERQFQVIYSITTLSGIRSDARMLPARINGVTRHERVGDQRP